MKYITKRSSETGKKFEELEKRKNEVWGKIKQLGEELGFQNFCSSSLFSLNIAAVKFDHQPDLKTFKKSSISRENMYEPRLSTKAGKEIAKKFKDCGSISQREINACIGYKNLFRTIGYDFSNKEFIGFEVKENWKVKVPEDCTEVTVTDYNNLFNKKP